jgi:hypothetical protein
MHANKGERTEEVPHDVEDLGEKVILETPLGLRVGEQGLEGALPPEPVRGGQIKGGGLLRAEGQGRWGHGGLCYPLLRLLRIAGWKAEGGRERGRGEVQGK